MNKIKRAAKALISIVLCLTMIVCAIPMVTANDDRQYLRLADLENLKTQYLTSDETAIKEYPNGSVFFPVISGELQMSQFYAVDIFRQGGTEGEASITVSTIDLTASYGEHYKVYTSNKLFDKAIDGEANPYYAISNFSFIPIVTETEVLYETENDTDNTQALRQEASEINDANLELMPVSGEFTVKFADGENVKTIYIETLKSDTVTDDLEFMLTLSNPENCSINTTTTASYTIKEEREKPDTYMQILDEYVNPDSNIAYVQVQRTGNLGGFDSFRIKTQSSTAKASESYTAVALNLTFSPGMTEIKVPIEILDGASDGQKFDVLIADADDDIILNDSKATVYFSSDSDIISEATTAFSSGALLTSGGTIKSKTRGKEIIDLSQFQKSRNIGSSYTATSSSSGAVLKYSNGASCKSHAVSMVSKNKINVTGVDSITAWYDIYGGSCVWDYTAFYVGDSDKLSNNDGSCAWMNSNELNGIGTYWDMDNISSDYKSQTATLNHSKVNGEHYIYLAMTKAGFWGSCGVHFYNEGSSSEHNMTLNLTKYNLSVIEAPTATVMNGGKLVEIALAENSMITDPAVTSSSSSVKGTNFDIYRNESVSIVSSINEKYSDSITFKGVYICDPNNHSNHSDLISLSSSNFTLSTNYLEKYSSYIKNNKIVIQPVYELAKADLSVESFVNPDNKVSFKVDSKNCTGTAYVEDKEIGKINWEKSLRSDGTYNVGDTIYFTFTPSDADDDGDSVWTATYKTRSADTEALLDQATIITHDEGTGNAYLTLDKKYYSVTPEFSSKRATTKLVVTNPNDGDFCGKNGDFSYEGEKNSQIVTGYKDVSGNNILFNSFSISSIITFTASPKTGYRAKWTYRDASDHQDKVYYGSTFYFAVQNPYYEKDNYVTLSFEKITGTVYTKYITGTTMVQEGSILNEPIESTAIYDIAPNTLLSMDGYTDMSDGNGKFGLMVDPNAEVPEAAQLQFCADEVHRVLSYRNDQYYISDVDMSQYANSTDSTANIEVNLPYKTYGVKPTGITAMDEDNNTFNDSITLVTAKGVRFDLTFSRYGEDKSRPVNMIRWTVESENGIEQTFDVDIEKTDLTCHWANVISEIINPGESLVVELFNKSYDDNANPIYSSYGKFDTGYTFIASSIEETVTYMPDIGVDSEASQGYTVYSSEENPLNTVATPIPCIGPISPTVSIKGFTPIINIGSTGEQDEEGHDINSVTIGIQFGKLKNEMADDPKYNSAGPLDKAKMLSEKLGALDEINNSSEGFKPFGGGSALKMKTAVNVSFSITFCFQGNYYVDEDSGEWRFTNSILIAGAGGAVRVSVPFVILYIPCFVFFTAEIKCSVFLGIYPKASEDGSQANYLTLQNLVSSELSEFHGKYEMNLNLGLGLGVGYDGLLNAQGSLTSCFKITYTDFIEGKGTYDLKGTVALELLFLKASWTGNIANAELFDTSKSFDVVESQVLSAINDTVNEEDILKTLTIGDFVVNKATEFDDEGIDLLSAVNLSEKVLESTTAVAEPSISKISDGIYFIASVMNCGEENSNILHYYIYDSNTDSITESDEVLAKLVSDIQSTDANADTDYISNSIDKIDHNVMTVDCGDDILIVWNKSNCSPDADSLTLLKSVSVASVFYNKSTGKFHDYKTTHSKEGTITFLPKAAYNENTGIVQLFYQQMDLSGVTANTTLEELINKPTKLMTIYNSVDSQSWSSPLEVSYSEKMLQFYDVISYKDNIMLSYVSSDTSGFVLDNFDADDYDTSLVDTKNYGTENALYIQQFSIDDNNSLKYDKPVQVADEEYVAADPEFVHIKNDKVDNTLLFYKCNGKYAYQNIDVLLSQAVYTDVDGVQKITDEYMEPIFITQEEDHTVNDDFCVYYNEDGTIYALWTATEGDQRQIWARHFYIEDITTVTETPKIDSDGVVIRDDSGNVVITKLSEPINILNGTWGSKNYLTTDGVGGTEIGMYKSNFAAAILDNGEILTAYNSCDYDYSTESATMINNQFIIAEYDPDANYKLPSLEDHMDFSDDYPNSGETVTVTMNAKNDGIKTGEDVVFTLYVNGKEYATQTVHQWLANEQQLVSVQYTLPQDLEADQVSMYFTISENGKVKSTSDVYKFKKDSKIIMTNASIMPIQNITDDNSEAKFYVTVDVVNTGNVDYNGGDVLKFVDSDLYAQTAVLDPDLDCTSPLYTSYGSVELPKIAVSEEIKVKFISDSIPNSVFEKNAGGDSANLEFVISPSEQADWTVINKDDTYSFIDEFNIGCTQKPKKQSVKSIELSDVVVTEGKTAFASYGATPSNSLIGESVEFVSSDESVATVDRFGMVTGVSAGTTTITLKANGVEAKATVTVKASDSLLGDVDNDGSVTIKDASLLQSYLVRLVTSDEINLSAADVNGDGRVSVTDATYIQLIITKYIVV